MPLADDSLRYLVCPDDRSSLSRADRALVDRLNAAFAAGRLANRAGKPVSQQLGGALVRADRSIAYAIVDDIPVLVVDEGIPLDQLERRP